MPRYENVASLVKTIVVFPKWLLEVRMGTLHFSLGIDVGSITTKVVVLDREGRVHFWTYARHGGDPLGTVKRALMEMRESVGIGDFECCTVTGSARDLVASILSVATANEIVCQAIAAYRLLPRVRTVVEIGGQDSKYILLGNGEAASGPVILTQRMNDVCAAGTGAFVEQQAEWLGVPVEEFGALALRSSSPATVAGRCAVFAKSDIVHLRQEGIDRADIAAGICDAVARNYLAQFARGSRLEGPVFFQGGLAANRGIVEAFRRAIGSAGDELVVPEHFRVTGAIGAAYRGFERDSEPIELEEIFRRIDIKKQLDVDSTVTRRLSSLSTGNVIRRMSAAKDAREGQTFALGIDVGSTSTCAALVSETGALIAKAYVLNEAGLLPSVHSALREVERVLGLRASSFLIGTIGVTGSGRYLVANHLAAGTVRDEISAQARAAELLVPEVDTVIEIGGQDAKFLRIASGRLVGFEMNRVCAAGTGAFLQEQARRLHEELGTLSDTALSASSPVNLGSRCTVFMESDLVHYQQVGCSKPDLIAGLSYSVAKNYLEKVVGGRRIGDKIVFLGGLAFNTSVAAALSQLIEKPIIVPEHHEVSAAIGVALLALEEPSFKSKPFSARTVLDLIGLPATSELHRFECRECENRCRVSEIRTGGERLRHGGICGKHETATHRVTPAPNIANQRQSLLQSWANDDGARSLERVARGRVGVPRVHLFFDQFPLWATYLRELGFQIVLSDATRGEVVAEGLQCTPIDNCFSCKVAYGHLANLRRKDVNWVWAPAVVEPERRVLDLERNHSCPHVQAFAAGAQAVFPELPMKIPVFTRETGDRDWVRELRQMGSDLGCNSTTVELALFRAAAAQDQFVVRRESLGKQALADRRPGQPVVVLLGKVYNVCDSGLNLNIATEFARRGVLALPFDCLPLSDERLPAEFADMVWAPGQDLLRAARWLLRHPDIHPVLITNFGCGPDSFAIKYLEEMFSARPFLVLEVDEHTSAVGVGTRVEAFLASLQATDRASLNSATPAFRPFVPDRKLRKLDKLLYVPLGFDSYRVIAAAFESIGIRTKVLPPHDDETLRLGRMYTAGNECLPYIMHVGDAVRMTQDPEFHPERSALFLPASDLACRVSAFPTSMKLVLDRIGAQNVPIIAPRLSMDKDELLKVFGLKFIANTFKGMLSMELLWRLQVERRPYECNPGEVDRVHRWATDELCRGILEGRFYPTLDRILERFDAIPLSAVGTRPKVGFIGDDYTRGNSYANGDVIRVLENLGAEVWTVPIWSSYLEFQMGVKPNRTWNRGKYFEFLADKAKATLGRVDIERVHRAFGPRLRCFPDPGFSDMLAHCAKSGLDPRTDPQVIIALSHLEHLLRRGADGIVNVVGFQCMIHNIIAARLKTQCRQQGAVPVLSLSFDFQEQVHTRNRIDAFIYQVEQHRLRAGSARNQSVSTPGVLSGVTNVSAM